MYNIGPIIKKLREERGWSQEELAEKMGYKSRSTINKIESGVNDVTQSNIRKFSSVFNVEIKDIMGWDYLQEKIPMPKYDPIIIEIIDLLAKLSSEEKDMILYIMRKFASQHDDK